MVAVRLTGLRREHIKLSQAGGKSPEINTLLRGANRRRDCDNYRPDTLGDGIGFMAARMFRGILRRNSAIALAESGSNVNQRLPPRAAAQLR